jgi:hypothetical protein
MEDGMEESLHQLGRGVHDREVDSAVVGPRCHLHLCHTHF